MEGPIAMPAADEILVVRRSLDATDEEVARFAATLNAPEQARVARYAFPHLRRNAIVSRGALRQLLGQLLRQEPPDLAFIDGNNGKPALTNRALDFNVSHTDRWLYLAFAHGRALGVDIEGGRALDPDELAPSVFTKAEQFDLATSDDRTLAFLRGWTRKEAYLKARGTGLSTPLHELSVSLRDQLGVLPLVTHVDHGERVSVMGLPAPDDHAAALAWTGTIDRVVLSDW